MIKPEEVIRIGKILKPHGVKGELSMLCENDCFDRSDDCDYLIGDMDGILVPFFIESYRFKGNASVLIKFDDIDTVEQAERMTGITIYFPKKYLAEEESECPPEEFLNGYTISDIHSGYIGTIKHIENATINILLVVERGEEEILIPFHEEFICEVNEEKHAIIMNLPEGLVQLNSDKTSNE